MVKLICLFLLRSGNRFRVLKVWLVFFLKLLKIENLGVFVILKNVDLKLKLKCCIIVLFWDGWGLFGLLLFFFGFVVGFVLDCGLLRLLLFFWGVCGMSLNSCDEFFVLCVCFCIFFFFRYFSVVLSNDLVMSEYWIVWVLVCVKYLRVVMVVW